MSLPKSSRPQIPHIDKVSAEIWTEIFKLGIRRLGYCLKAENLARYGRGHLSISQTCRRWREIAIGEPRLWSTINVRADGSPYPKISLIKLWLERSKDVPLSVNLYILSGIDKFERPETYECFAAVFLHAERWKFVEMYVAQCYNDPDSWDSLEAMITSAPLLESISMEVDSGSYGEYGLLPSNFWTSSPLLHTLKVKLQVNIPDHIHPFNYEVSRWATSYNIPYGQITNLCLVSEGYEKVDIGEIAIIFQTAPNLVSCVITEVSDVDPDSTFDIATPPVVLQHLKHLHLGASLNYLRVSTLANVLEYVNAPSLLKLTFVDAGKWNRESYRGFMARSLCPLEELHFYDKNRYIAVEDFVDCVHLSPYLKGAYYRDWECPELKLGGISEGSSALRYLSEDRDPCTF